MIPSVLTWVIVHLLKKLRLQPNLSRLGYVSKLGQWFCWYSLLLFLYIQNTLKGVDAFLLGFLELLSCPLLCFGMLDLEEKGSFGKFQLCEGTKMLNIKHFSFEKWATFVAYFLFYYYLFWLIFYAKLLVTMNSTRKNQTEGIQEPDLLKTLSDLFFSRFLISLLSQKIFLSYF